MTEENQTKPNTSENLNQKSPSRSESGESEHNSNTEYAENEPENANKDDEMFENSNVTAGEGTIQETDAKKENIEGSEGKSEEVDGEMNEQRADNTTNGSTGKSESETGKERDASEVMNEEEVKGNKDSQLENEDVGNTNTAQKEIVVVETPAVTANEEKDSGNSKELLEDTNKEVSEDDGGKTENGNNEENVENSDEKIADNVQEGVPIEKKETGEIGHQDSKGQEGSSKDKGENVKKEDTVVETNGSSEEGISKDRNEGGSIKVDNEVVDKYKDEQSEVDKNVGNKDDEMPVTSTTGSESDIIETGNESSRGEQVEKHEESQNDVDYEGGNIDNEAGEQQVEEQDVKIETKQDGCKESEMAVSEGMEDDAKDADSEDTTVVKTEAVAENVQNETEHQVGSNGEVAEDLVENATENSNEDLSKEDNVENEEKGTPDKTSTIEETSKITTGSKENESETVAGPGAILESSHESHSQVVNTDDNKSEVPSENIDELVEELLAETDDVDAGKNDKGSLPEATVEVSVVASEGSGVKSDDGGQVQEAEPQHSVEAEKSLSEHPNTDVKDAEESKETEKRVESGSVYRVQTDYLTRQVIAKQEKEIYLEEKLSETSRDLEIAERKVKDLQLRLKRFVKDDEAKDHKIRQMEREYKDLADQMQRIEESLDSKSKNNNVGEVQNVKKERQRMKSRSKVCVIL